MTTLRIPNYSNNGNGHTAADAGRPMSWIAGSESKEPSSIPIHQISEWLRVFIGRDQVTQLMALDVSQPGLEMTFHKNGFFDGDHIDLMARHAAELSGSARGVYFTLNPLSRDVLAVRSNRLCRTRPGEAASDTDTVSRLWLPIDVDPVRRGRISATDEEKAKACSRCLEVRDFLADQGFTSPVFADSGNGYHLHYRIELPPDDELPSRVLRSLDAKFSDDVAKVDTTVGNASRIMRLYGTLACKGDSTRERPHRMSRLLDVPNELHPVDVASLRTVARMADEQPQPRTSPTPNTGSTSNVGDSQKLVRARAYVATIPAAVTGNGGDARTFEVACRLVLGFDLTPEESLPLLLEYNQRCQPPWEELDLRRKLELANERDDDRGRGYLLGNLSVASLIDPVCTDDLPLEGEMCLGVIPDFLPVPTLWCLPFLDEGSVHPTRGRPRLDMDKWLLWPVVLAVWQQKRSPAVIPEKILSQYLYGAKVPSRWAERLVLRGGRKRTMESGFARERRVVQHGLDELGHELTEVMTQLRQRGGSIYWQEREATLRAEIMRARNERSAPNSTRPNECPEYCPLHTSPVRHSHYQFKPNSGVLAGLCQLADESDDGVLRFDFDKKSEGKITLLGELVANNLVYWAYLPVEILGPAAGLSVREVRLMQGLMRERTHQGGRRKPTRGQDRIEYVVEGLVPATNDRKKVHCPVLDRDSRYVLFGGNLPGHRGRGYRLIGKIDSDQSWGGWLRRAGYPVFPEMPDAIQWGFVSRMLGDLKRLSDRFGLTPAAIGQDGNWKTLDEMLAMNRGSIGQRWLGRCRLQVFAPDNYLVLWRRWFAEKLGFSFISGGEWSPPKVQGKRDGHRSGPDSPEKARVWLTEVGVSQKHLASLIGWSESRVSRQLTGVATWSPRFAAAMKALQERMEAE